MPPQRYPQSHQLTETEFQKGELKIGSTTFRLNLFSTGMGPLFERAKVFLLFGSRRPFIFSFRWENAQNTFLSYVDIKSDSWTRRNGYKIKMQKNMHDIEELTVGLHFPTILFWKWTSKFFAPLERKITLKQHNHGNSELPQILPWSLQKVYKKVA